MSRVWYLPTVDERDKPIVVKVIVIGERGGWRMIHQCGASYKGEGEIVVHARHLTQNWLAAWIKAKRISRLRRQRNVVRDAGGRGKGYTEVYTPKRGRYGDDLTKPVTARRDERILKTEEVR